MTSQMTVGKKLLLGFSAILALVLALGYASVSSIGTLTENLDTAVNSSAKKIAGSADFNGDTSDMVAFEARMGLRAMIGDTAAVDKYHQAFGEKAAHADQTLKDVRPLLITDAGRSAADAMQSGLAAWKSVHQEFLALCTQSKDNKAIVAFIPEKVAPISDRVQAAGDDLTKQSKTFLATSAKESAETSSRARWITLVLIGLCIAVGVVVFFVIRQINRSLRQAVTELSEGAEQTASAAAQVSSSSQSLAQGSSEQAASLEETSASSEEINSMARKNTENSRSAADLVTQSQQKFVQTSQSLEQTVAAMGEINEQSGKISKIIKVIDEIAFQTNILALNAAVEAARAGEAGMGFAVVADEVRNLAQRCAQAAKDTAALIEESIAKSNDGKVKVDQVATAIRAIIEESARVKTLVDEVNLGSQEQARGIEQIGKAITQMEQVTQKTAANAEESASAAEELNAQSETLKDVVVRLTVMVGGGEAANGPARPVRRAAANVTAQASRRPGETAHGLTALRNVVSRQPRSPELGAPALPAHGSGKDSFPLEDQFKEF
jgi:methyl-accepting chemotaxis protein